MSNSDGINGEKMFRLTDGPSNKKTGFLEKKMVIIQRIKV